MYAYKESIFPFRNSPPWFWFHVPLFDLKGLYPFSCLQLYGASDSANIRNLGFFCAFYFKRHLLMVTGNVLWWMHDDTSVMKAPFVQQHEYVNIQCHHLPLKRLPLQRPYHLHISTVFFSFFSLFIFFLMLVCTFQRFIFCQHQHCLYSKPNYFRCTWPDPSICFWKVS